MSEQKVKVTFVDEHDQIYSVDIEDYAGYTLGMNQYDYWFLPECDKSKDGEHKWVNVGFTSEILVCKFCDKESK